MLVLISVVAVAALFLGVLALSTSGGPLASSPIQSPLSVLRYSDEMPEPAVVFDEPMFVSVDAEDGAIFLAFGDEEAYPSPTLSLNHEAIGGSILSSIVHELDAKETRAEAWGRNELPYTVHYRDGALIEPYNCTMEPYTGKRTDEAGFSALSAAATLSLDSYEGALVAVSLDSLSPDRVKVMVALDDDADVPPLIEIPGLSELSGEPEWRYPLLWINGTTWSVGEAYEAGIAMDSIRSDLY